MLRELKQKPESYRHKVALGSSFAVSLMILSVWAYSKGFFGFSNEVVLTKSNEGDVQQLAAVYPASDYNQKLSISSNTSRKTEANSPLTNTKNAFAAAFEQMGVQFDSLKESIASVIVPFITGIDVYNK